MDINALVRTAEDIVRAADVDGMRESLLPSSEQEKIVRAYLVLQMRRRGRHLDDGELEAFAPDLTKVLNWAIRTRLASATLDLALSGRLVLMWDSVANDVAPLPTKGL